MHIAQQLILLGQQRLQILTELLASESSNSWQIDSVFCQQLARAISLSDLLFDTLQREPAWINTLYKMQGYYQVKPNYLQLLAQQVAVSDDKQVFLKQLRKFRYQHFAYLAWLQALNLATVEQIFQQLSALADAIIQYTANYFYQTLSTRYGVPVSKQKVIQPFIIIAMGKLGGIELNFSSDVDLIFTYPEIGDTARNNYAISNEEFFIKLGQQLIDALSAKTEDGFVYRVDMRLRPFGDSGSLVWNFIAFEDYYQTQGRDWERYAMIKARIIGESASNNYHQQLKQMLKPFVYRRYIDFSVLQALRDMKDKISREVKLKKLENNIKLGSGGIREIEFVTQVFQLIYGGQKLELQSNSILTVLQQLEKLQLLSPEKIKILKLNYLLLRRIENTLQAINDQQIQTLPTHELDQARLVCAVANYTINDAQQIQHSQMVTWQDFQQLLTTRRQQTHAIFQELIMDSATENKTNNWQHFFSVEVNINNLTPILRKYPNIDVTDYAEISELLYKFKYEIEHKTIGNRGRSILDKLISKIFHQVCLYDNAKILLQRVIDFIVTISSRTAYLELLFENNKIIQYMLNIFAESPFIVDMVTEYPSLLDELLYQSHSFKHKSVAEYQAELSVLINRLDQNDEELVLEKLRRFKHINLFRIAYAEITKIINAVEVSQQLTNLAEALMPIVVNWSWAQILQKYQVTTDIEQHFMIIAYGKFGSAELNYNSDLDLVFIYDEQSTVATSINATEISNMQFYLRLVQKIISTFKTNMHNGILYDIDTQLRPSGNSGLLISSMDAFEHYQLEQAWTWEKQALIRARPVYRNKSLCKRFTKLRKQVLVSVDDVVQLKIDVLQMREKMLSNLVPQKQFNLKKSRGSITDIEFIVQYLVLANAKQYPELVEKHDNISILRQLATLHIISEQQAEQLITIYVLFSSIIHNLCLAKQEVTVDEKQLQAEIDYILNFWQNLFEINNLE